MDDTATFEELRPRLFGLAYRMLGSVADAEDIVQDAYLRWHRRPAGDVASPRAYLMTVVARLSLDSLSSARARRERYVGPWLPEPLLVDDADPAEAASLADSLSMAFLVLLEELSPLERAAFLLHDVFDYGYPELADVLGKDPAACRQLVSRARRHVAAHQRRFDADRTHAAELTQRFAAACSGGDLDELVAMLTEDVTVWSDGGGRVRSARRPVYGRDKAARFLLGIVGKIPDGAEYVPMRLNGQPGILVVYEGAVVGVVVVDVMDGRVAGVRIVTNPDKLQSANHFLRDSR